MSGAKIYSPSRTATQSGTAQTRDWVLEFEPEGTRYVEPLMGWTATKSNKAQIRLRFSTREKAVEYAERNDISYSVTNPHKRIIKPKSYSDNFAFAKKRN